MPADAPQTTATDDEAAMAIDPTPPGVTMRSFTEDEMHEIDASLAADPAIAASIAEWERTSGPPVHQTTPPRAPVFRCAECGAVWRTERQRDLCCTAK